MKKLISILVALAMMMTLCLTAFAEGAVSTNGKVYITKTLNIAPGLTAPEEFNFTAIPVSRDGEVDESMPTITIPATSGIQGTKATDGNIIKNVEIDLNTVSWAHAGTYVYTVKEVAGSTSGMTYDPNEYTMTIRIKNGPNNTFIVDQVQVTDGNTKVDPTLPDDPTDDDEDDGKNDDGFNFDNTYRKIADDTDTDEDDDPDTPNDGSEKASYVLTKTVTGDYGDLTKAFKFAVSVDIAGTNYTEGELNIKYYKYPAEGAKAEVNPADFSLAHGEKLVIEGVPVGAHIDVTENLAADEASKKYTATVAAKADSEDLTVGPFTEGENGVIDNALIGEGVNNAAYTNRNTKDETPLTGILMNNLPYILLAVVAAGGLIAYLMMKRREANSEA